MAAQDRHFYVGDRVQTNSPIRRKQHLSRRFRNGTVDDVPLAAHLIHHSFPRPGRSLEECERLLTDPHDGGINRLWVVEVDGRLVGACRLLRYDQWIAGQSIPVMGLSAVAISPSARRTGLAADLVASGLRHARDRGDVASLLYPFRTSFYRRLGYGMAGEAMQYVVPTTALYDHPARHRVQVAFADDDRAAAAAVYDRWAPTRTGQFVRPAWAWRQVWDDGTRHAAIYRDEAGTPYGYLVFRYQRDATAGRSAVEVEEAAWLSAEARLGLYGWLSALADQWELIVYRAHPQERFEEYVRELRLPALPNIQRWHYWFPAAVKMMGPMFRLIDLPAAWALRRVNPGEPLKVALRLKDDVMAKGITELVLQMEDGRVEVRSGGRARPGLSIDTDVETLSRIYIGSLDLASAVAVGRAKVDRSDRVGAFDSLLSVPLPWTFDRF